MEGFGFLANTGIQYHSRLSENPGVFSSESWRKYPILSHEPAKTVPRVQDPDERREKQNKGKS
eukprot:1324314-Amorphochlora_amoeboformis.AAC.1